MLVNIYLCSSIWIDIYVDIIYICAWSAEPVRKLVVKLWYQVGSYVVGLARIHHCTCEMYHFSEICSLEDVQRSALG